MNARAAADMLAGTMAERHGMRLMPARLLPPAQGLLVGRAVPRYAHC